MRGCLAPQGRALQSSSHPQGLVPQEPRYRNCAGALHCSLLSDPEFQLACWLSLCWLLTTFLMFGTMQPPVLLNLRDCLWRTFSDFCWVKRRIWFDGSAIEGVSQSFTSLCSLIFIAQHSRICWKAGATIVLAFQWRETRRLLPAKGNVSKGNLWVDTLKTIVISQCSKFQT